MVRNPILYLLLAGCSSKLAVSSSIPSAAMQQATSTSIQSAPETNDGGLSTDTETATSVEQTPPVAPAGPAPSPIVSAPQINGLPTTISSSTDLVATLSGKDIAAYRYKVGSGTAAICASSSGYSDAVAGAGPINVNVTAIGDGPVALCIIVKNSAGTWQSTQSAASSVWIKDATPPVAASGPLSFDLLAGDQSKAHVSWTPGSDAGAGVAKQQLLFFGSNDTDCTGDPGQTIDLSATATSYDWSRLSDPPVDGFVRFLLRTVDNVGLTTDSPCSGDFKLRNGMASFPGTIAEQGLASFQVFFADVTGDGIDDIIMTDYTWNSDTGYVAIIPGGADISKSHLHVYTGSAANSYLQLVQNYASNLPQFADVSGDGIIDLVLTERSSPNGLANAGSIYILRGRATFPADGTIDSAADARIDGVLAGDSLGSSTFLFDITGDGVADIISQSAGASPNGVSSAGSIFVIPGSPSLTGIQPVTTVGRRYDGEYSGDFCTLGPRVSTNIVDINGDGVLDYLFGCAYASPGGNLYTGSLYVITGSPSLPASGPISTVQHRYDGAISGDEFGQDARLVDITGDGKPDFIATNEGNAMFVLPNGPLPPSGPIATAGRRYTGTQGLCSDNFMLYGQVSWQYFYFADVNGDGITDLVCSSNFTNAGGLTSNGSIFVLLGSATLPPSGTFAGAGMYEYDGSTNSEHLSIEWSGVHLADVAGAGSPQLIVPALFASPGGLSNAGSIYILQPTASHTMPPSGSIATAAFRRYDGDAANDRLGDRIWTGQVTGDAAPDIVSYSSTASPGGLASAGSIFVIPGGAGLPASGAISTVGKRYDGDAANDSLGYWGGGGVFSDFFDNIDGSPLVDLNGDGYADLVSISSTASPGGIASAGSFYIIPGGATLPPSGHISTAGKRYDGEFANDKLGSSVSLVDLNGDGRLDLFGSTSTASPGGVAGAGSAYLLLSGNTLPPSGPISVAGRRYDGGYASAGLQLQVYNGVTGANAPILIRADSNASPGGLTGAGAIYMIPTGAALPASGVVDAVANVIAGDATNEHLGVNLTTADLNGDGLTDLIFTTQDYSQIWVAYGNADASKISKVLNASSAWGDDPQAGAHIYTHDVTGDGKLDLILNSGLNSQSTSSNGLTHNGGIYVLPNEFLLRSN